MEADLVSVNNIDFVRLEGSREVSLNVQKKNPLSLEGGMKKDRGYRKW